MKEFNRATRDFNMSDEMKAKLDRFTPPVYEVKFEGEWEPQSFRIVLTKVHTADCERFDQDGASFSTEIELPGGSIIQFELTLTSPKRDV